MRMLAIETATEACSVALFDDGALLAAHHEVPGRGHAERLVPLIAGLPDKGRAAQIRVSLGPGSFTGVRIGLAVARALGVAWGAEVRGYPTLSLLARQAVTQSREGVLVCMNGGHGEWLVQAFDHAANPIAPFRSCRPEDATGRFGQPVVVGSRAREFVAARGWGDAEDMLPDARAVGGLAEDLLTTALTPLYGRPPDAKLPT